MILILGLVCLLILLLFIYTHQNTTSSNPDVSTGADCNANTPCSSGLYCVNNTCSSTPIADGDTCQYSTACKSGLCNSEKCAASGTIGTLCPTGVCNSGLYCVNNTCSSTPIADGDTCQYSTACKSGMCTNGNCLKSNGVTCSSASSCANGYCTNGICSGTPKSLPGATCSTGFECTTDMCENSTCAGFGTVANSALPIATNCNPESTTETCISGSTCTEQTKNTGIYYCRSTTATTPDSNGECQYGQIVIDGTCYIPRPIGMYCQNDNECITSNCTSNICRPTNILTDPTGNCNPMTGPFCPSGYYCSGTSCTKISTPTTSSSKCDMGGSNACEFPYMCNTKTLNCMIPDEFVYDPTDGYTFYYTTVTNSPSPYFIDNNAYSITGSQALAKCTSTNNCQGVIPGNNHTMQLSHIIEVQNDISANASNFYTTFVY